MRYLPTDLAARPALDWPVLVSGLIFALKMLGFVLASLCGLAVFLIIVGKRVIRRILHPRS